MTPRERVAAALRHEIPDYVPIDIGGTANGFTIGTMAKLKEHFGIETEDEVFFPCEAGGHYNDALIEAMGGDFKHIFIHPSAKHKIVIENDIFYDEWGMKKKLVHGYAQQIENPLRDAEIEELDDYPFPDPYEPARVEGLRQRARDLYENTDYAISARAPTHGFMELGWELRGMDNFLVDLLIDEDFANALLDRIMEFQMGIYDAMLTEVGEYVQIVQTGDDYGTQNGPLISPELFRKYVVPRRRKLNELIRKKAPHAYISHHSCGSVAAFVDDLIDCGVDILNPVQPLARDMDPAGLKKRYGDRISFHGAIDEQQALIGPLEGLEEEMKNRILALAPGGGYILAPTSNFQEDMPLENILNFVPLARKYGIPSFYQKAEKEE